MTGAINNFSILAHPIVTIRCFGWRIFFKALFAKHNDTFLSLLNSANIFKVSKSEVSDFFDRLVQMEMHAKHIYTSFAKTFASNATARHFFEILASQEQDHADMLEICRAATIFGHCKINCLKSADESLSQLEQRMNEILKSYTFITSLDDALRMVIDIESTEVNQIFQDVFASSDSHFVRKLLQVRRTINFHISYIAKNVHALSPLMTQASLQLQEELAGII